MNAVPNMRNEVPRMYDKNIIERLIREGQAKEPPMIHGAMFYRCKNCGKTWIMWLEVGVEDHGENGRPHQPCPFTILCDCGGFANDISGYLDCGDVFPLNWDGGRYFAYDHSDGERACGRPRVYQTKGGDKVNSMPSLNELTSNVSKRLTDYMRPAPQQGRKE